jgi:hypothetical protein
MLADLADCFGFVGVVVDGRGDAFKAHDVPIVYEILESIAS